MAYQLKLKNVTDYKTDTTPSGSKYYTIEAQNEDKGPASRSALYNRNYVQNSESADENTFDWLFSYIQRNGESKRIFEIKGLKLDGVVQYDAENHTFTATVDQDQSFGIEFPNLEYYTNSLNSLMNNPSYTLLGE